MSELQRVFLAVLLCMGIFFGYQYILLRYAPPVQQNNGQVADIQGDHAAPPSAPVAAVVPTPTPTPAGADIVVPPESRHFETPLFAGTLTNQSSGLSALELSKFRDKVEDNGPNGAVSLVAGDTPDAAQARIVWVTPGGAPALRFAGDGNTLQLQGKNQANVAVSVQVKPRPDTYALDYVIRAVNEGSAPTSVGAQVVLSLVGRTKEEGHSFLPGMKAPGIQLNALCDVNGDLDRNDFASVEKKTRRVDGAPSWIALDRQYFLVAVLPEADAVPAAEGAVPSAGGHCVATSRGDLLDNAVEFAAVTVPAGGTWEKHFSLYVGPKVDDQLQAVSPRLLDSVDYTIWHIPMGFIARPMVVLLKVFQGWTSSWGMAIVLLTVLVKLLLLPLSLKGAASMRRMQQLKPELDRIKTQFANDRERQQLEQMKLFKEKGVNPMGGCLPTLLQMPVGLALYRMLWSAVDLYHQPFLWLPDLTGKEPFPILAVLLGVITFLQQRMMPVAMDNQQAKVMMYVMPAMLTFFMLALPSGLVVYILVNSILTIIQQLAINKRSVAV